MRTLIRIVIRTLVLAAITPALFLLDYLTFSGVGANIGLGILLLALLLFVPMIWAALDARRMPSMTWVTVWAATVVLAATGSMLIRAALTGTAQALEPDVAIMTFGLMAVGACLGGLVGLSMRASSANGPPGQD